VDILGDLNDPSVRAQAIVMGVGVVGMAAVALVLAAMCSAAKTSCDRCESQVGSLEGIISHIPGL
jgi:hypothetical protein